MTFDDVYTLGIWKSFQHLFQVKLTVLQVVNLDGALWLEGGDVRLGKSTLSCSSKRKGHGTDALGVYSSAAGPSWSFFMLSSFFCGYSAVFWTFIAPDSGAA